MDEKSNQLLQDILNQQKQQTDLLRQNLGRLRFSMRALLILMTLVAVALGYVGYKQQQFTSFMPVPVRIAGPIYANPASRAIKYSGFISGKYPLPASPQPAPATPITLQFPTVQATGNNNALVQ